MAVDPGVSPRVAGLREIIREQVTGFLRRGEFGSMLGRANASPTAQSEGSGIGIQNVRRMVARAQVTGLGAHIPVTATEYAPLATPLAVEVVLSGRPVKITLSGNILAGSGGGIFVDVTVRGKRISGVVNGMVSSDSTAGETVTGVEIVEGLPAGRAKIEVVAFRITADGSILADGSNRFVLLAEEL